MAVVSVEKQPDSQGTWVAKLVFQLATLFIDVQCTRAQYPSRFPLKMLQYAAEHGHVLAMSGLGRLLYKSGACRAERRSGLEYVRQAAKYDDPEAQFTLGNAYLQDDTYTQKNTQLATHWLALASDNGHTQAAQKLRSIAQQEAQQNQAEHRETQRGESVTNKARADKANREQLNSEQLETA